MASPNKWITDAEIERSKELTRRNPQTTFRHHVVPRMYLKRWSSNGHQVRVVDLNVGSVADVDPDIDAAASEEFFYEIEAHDVDPDDNPSMWFETHMGRIEDKAAHWLRALDSRPDGRIRDTNLLSNLAVYVGLQSQRTFRGREHELTIDRAIAHYGAEYLFDIPDVLSVLAGNYGIPYTHARHREIAQSIVRTQLISAETQPKAIESAIGVWREQVVPHLEQHRSWWLISTESPLLTCDDPVIRIGTKRQTRELPIPYKTAPLILFPAGPRRLLVLAPLDRPIERPHHLTVQETGFVNRELAFNSNGLLFDQPGSTVAAGMTVPPYPAESTGFPQTLSSYSEFVRALSPNTRWTGAPYAPQWPLSRWTS
ncbi:hypothetical protein GCM10007304_47020 [Rhodococcoides trifolii]|uniref:DUF4238 domain-containing protein n=1 Tax=Rhodococcoides trifolii TaxID=908250 RepID=A0A917G811_9NOCA|nr:DUF4238 domain-containing protein [Rhodococcus trifolii]GGG27788.1 hypothetical protein GCM10007304_47020 [Rhodococcus trifolii]